MIVFFIRLGLYHVSKTLNIKDSLVAIHLKLDEASFKFIGTKGTRNRCNKSTQSICTVMLLGDCKANAYNCSVYEYFS